MAKCKNCGKHFVKKTPTHLFCSNGRTGAGNCKDAYWNKHDPRKRNRNNRNSHLDNDYSWDSHKDSF